MSRVAKWKLEKTKVKVVFRLQFHATHIPQTGWDKLFISFIPAESGKATAKTTKSNVRNGTCKWGDPIYETTRLLQDVKTKQFDEKLYKLVVTMGSSRSSLLGEASINLADYADASKPTVVQLPLKGSSDYGALLHVTVQLLTSKTGFREFEQQREVSERGLQASSDHDGSRGSLSGDIIGSNIDKVSSRVKFKPEQKLLPSLEEEAGLSSEYADMATGLDVSSNTSEILYAEKHDASGLHDVDSVKSTMSGDTPGISLSQSPTPEKGDSSNNREWVHYYGSDNSVDHDLGIVYREDTSLKGALEAAELSVLELTKEVTSLQTHTDDIGNEMQKLTEILADEVSSTTELAKNVSVLKSECSQFKGDIEHLTNLKMNLLLSRSGNNSAVQSQLSGWLKSILNLEDKIRDIQNKAYIGFHEKDFRFLIPDLDSVLSVLLDLKQGTGDFVSSVDNIPAGEPAVGNFSHITVPNSNENMSTAGFGMDVCQPEGLLGLNIPGLVSQETDATKAMQVELFKLLRELDESKSERESLARKMDQMECYYEALVQELEENQKQMLGELQNLRNEHSTCIYTLSSSKAQIDAMHQDMSDQILHFAEERRTMDSLNKELERRSIVAEAALRRARLNYSIAVNQLQKDLEVLSLQVLSMYETNENLIRKAFTEVSQPCLEDYPEVLQSDNLDTKDLEVSKNAMVQNQKVGVRNSGMLLEDFNSSLVFQEELYKKIEQEVFEISLTNIYLDVFARSLQGTLQEAIADSTLKNCRLNDLMVQLELSMKSNEALTLKLQAAEDAINALREENAGCTSRENELALHNQDLEANLRSLSVENHDLAERFIECEALVLEYKIFKSRYEACDAERTALTNSLDEASAENSNLVDKISLLQDELKKISTESDELLSSKKSLQKLVDFLQQKLQNMLSGCDGQIDGVSFCHEFLDADLELKRSADAVLLLENHHNTSSEKMLRLMKEKISIEEERDIANVSLTAKNSELEALRKKFELDIEGRTCKLEEVNVGMDSIQAKLDNVYERLKLFSEAEESYTGIKEELLSDLSRMEIHLHELSGKNGDLSREIYTLGVSSEELGGVKMAVTELNREKQDLIACLQSKSDELLLLESETSSLRENVRILTDELSAERNSRKILTNELSDVTSELNEKNVKLLCLGQQEAELVNLRKQFQDLELEKSRVSDELSDITSQLNEKNTTMMQFERQQAELDLSRSQSQEAELDNLRKQFQDLEVEKSRVCDELSDITSQLNESNTKLLQFEQQQAVLVLSRSQSQEAELEHLRKQFQDLELEKSRVCDELSDITSQLSEKNAQLHQFEQQQVELLLLRNQFLDSEAERSRVCSKLLDVENILREALDESTSINKLEAELVNMHEQLTAADITEVFIRTQCECQIQDLVQLLESSKSHIVELNNKNLDLQSMFDESLHREANYVTENTNLQCEYESAKSQLEEHVALNKAIQESNSALAVELGECMKNKSLLECSFSEAMTMQAFEVEQLSCSLSNSLMEIDSLISSKEELEIIFLVLRAKLDEQFDLKILLEQYDNELMMLQKWCDELSQRLSEQTLKSEEFKNLSIHLKELIGKADAESSRAREKKEDVAQESLRIAFIKEQYETKVQELRLQLSVSKKHGEEMLMKLQDAIDEVEKRRKAEASHLKRNEELSSKISELEDKLRSALSDNRDKVMAYDQVKAELECSLISLDCCKEEKQKLVFSLEECNAEKSRIVDELSVMRECLSNSAAAKMLAGEKELSQTEQSSCEPATGVGHPENEDETQARVREATGISSSNASPGNGHHKKLQQQRLRGYEEENGSSMHLYTVHGKEQINSHTTQGDARDIQEGSLESPSREYVLGSSEKTLSPRNDHLKTQTLKSSMDFLHKELEKMKSENSLLSDDEFEPHMEGLHRELIQLEKVNEELQNMSPEFRDFSSYGNSIERVLALVMELAEALKAKKSSTLQFQSSFLKQHSDEAAVFRSFKDINDLIKDMLDLKGKYNTVETELKEMHGRYSELSIQFAEVEGERQKLMMTLKNVRSPRRLSGRGSPASPGGPIS